MEKPHWFDMKDMLTYGLIALLMCALFGVSWFVNIFIGDRLIRPQLGLGISSIVSIGVYINIMRLKYNYLKDFEWYPRFGLMIKKYGFKISKPEIEDLFERTLETWEKETQLNVRPIVIDNPIYITFLPHPVKTKKGREMNGFVIPWSFEIFIGVKNTDTILDTSLEHELNHLIYGHYVKSWDELEHHERFVDIGFINPA